MTDAHDALAQVREALAAGPTPGPWYLRTNRHPTTDGRAWGWLDTQPPGGGQYAPPGLQITWERGSKSEANADYIAACNPAAIAALLAEIERLTRERDEARAELERERMRLAACGVVAMSNTPESAARNREMHADYRSASCDDVASAVNREMALRADAERYRLLRRGQRWSVIDGIGDMLRADVLDAAIDAALAQAKESK